MRNSLTRWTIVVLVVALTACKPPRSPRERATGSVTGDWTGESVPMGARGDTGSAAWRLALEERDGGRVSGRGSLRGADGVSGFRLSGVRGESEITLYFDLPAERVKFHGGIRHPSTLVGELYLPGDTVPLTFTRR